MGAIEIGIRELQRSTSDVLARVQDEGLHAVVSRYGRPIAVLIPLDQAQAWVLQNRPLPHGASESDESWPEVEGVRLAPAADQQLAELSKPIRRSVMLRLRRLRRCNAVGRVAVKAGQLWALADLNGDRPPTLLEVARSAQLRRWFYAQDRGDQPM